MSIVTEQVALTSPRDFTLALIAEVAAKHDVTVEDILSASRQNRIVQARREAIWVVRNARPALSYPALGRIFRRDHSTVMYHLAATKRGMMRKAERLTRSQLNEAIGNSQAPGQAGDDTDTGEACRPGCDSVQG